MPDDPTRQYRRIRCRLRGSTVAIDLGADQRLFLSHGEAERLAADLEVELVCTGENVSAEVTVADVRLTADEGWQLVEGIHGLLDADNRHHRLTTARADVAWWREGF